MGILCSSYNTCSLPQMSRFFKKMQKGNIVPKNFKNCSRNNELISRMTLLADY